MVETIFSTIGDVVTNFSEVLGNAAQAIVNLFYTAGEAGGAGQLTFLGVVTLISVGTGIVYWAFQLIQKMLKQSNKK